MNRNKLMWGVVTTTVLITIAVSYSVISGQKQSTAKGQDRRKGYEDLSKFPEVRINEPEPTNEKEREEKKRKGLRYDRKDMVQRRVHPETGLITVEEVTPPLPPIPVAESGLIFIGKTLNARSYLSNDKTAVYSEYQVVVLEVIKNDPSANLQPQMTINLDRLGGSIIYPNGQKVIYSITGRNLPRVGSDYVFFVRKDNVSPNLDILTGYEFFNNIVYPLDSKGGVRKYRGYDVMSFINLIRNMVQSPS